MFLANQNELSDVQLNNCETGPYFLQNFQCVTMLIHPFCKIWGHEIFRKSANQNKNNFMFANLTKTRESTLFCIGNFEENIDLSHIY